MDAAPIIIVLLIAVAFVWNDRRKLRQDRQPLDKQWEELAQAREEQRRRAEIRNERLDRETDEAIRALAPLRSRPVTLGAASISPFDTGPEDYQTPSRPEERGEDCDDGLPGYDITAAAGLDQLDQMHGYYGAGQASVNGWFAGRDNF